MRSLAFQFTVICWLCVSEMTSATEPPITAVAFAPKGDFVVGVSQAGVHVFRWPDLQRQQTFQAIAPNLHCIAFSPQGDLLAIGGGLPAEEGSVEVFSWPAGKSVHTMNDHEDSVLAIIWKDQDTLLSASIDRQIKLWNLQQKSAERSFLGHSRRVVALCLTKTGTTLVSAGEDQSLRVWDLKASKLVRSMNQHTQGVLDLALRPVEGGLPMVASAASDRTIRFWQPTIGRMVRYVRLDSKPLGIAWLQDGSRIVAACVDGKIRVVDPEEVKVTQTLQGVDSWAYAVAVHPADKSVVVAGANGQIRRIVLAKET